MTFVAILRKREWWDGCQKMPLALSSDFSSAPETLHETRYEGGRRLDPLPSRPIDDAKYASHRAGVPTHGVADELLGASAYHGSF